MAVRRSSGLASVLGSSLGTIALLAGCVTVGCSAGSGPGGDSDGNGADGNGDGNGAGAGSNGGLSGVGSGSGGSGGPGSGKYCDEVTIDFVPRTPTVMVLVDRSSSMFEQGFWQPLKTGVLSLIQTVQSDVRFGFASFTGTKTTCTGMDAPTSFALDSYATIEAAYNALGDLAAGGGEKGETPTPRAIQQATAHLLADDSPGDRFILLVTDGSPDDCDDDYAFCGIDSLVAELQIAASQGIRTFVFGIENASVTKDLFDFYAQAGFGETPVPSATGYENGGVYGQYDGTAYNRCSSHTYWAPQRARLGYPNPANGTVADSFRPNGAYSATGGTREAFLDSDPNLLAEQIRDTVEGLKSCQLDLTTSGVEVTAAGEESGEIYIENVLIPVDQWHMNTPTQLELTGDACAFWQLPESNEFFAGFTCAQIVIR